MEQEHRITYKAGITRTPSDFLCQDGELAECINLATDNEELKPVVQPASYITSAENAGGTSIEVPTLLYIHKFNKQERYICCREWNYLSQIVYPLCWCVKNNNTLVYQEDLDDGGMIFYNNSINITSVGKTLIVYGSDGIKYFLWDNLISGYKNLGIIPDPIFDFSMYSPDITPPQYITGFAQSVISSGNPEGIVDEDPVYPTELMKYKEEDYNDLVVGLYSKNKKSISHKKGFCLPFFIRTAVRLYDGTYTNISQPILMMPFIYENSFVRYLNGNEFKLITLFCKLYFSQTRDYSDWSDIVKDITVFVSKSIDIYETQTDIPYMANITDMEFRGIYKSTINGNSRYHQWGFALNE